MNQLSISVIIPSYKPGAYLEKCLGSLAAQTLPHGRFEVIVVLNGCREPYHSYVDGLLEELDMSARLLQTDVAGASNARNIGLEAAQGDYLAFIDDDDWLSPNYLENLLACATPDGIAVSNVCMIDDATGEQLPNYVARAYAICANECEANGSLRTDLSRRTGGRGFMSVVWGKVIPRAVVGDVRYRADLPNGQDAVFVFEISKRIKRLTLCQKDTIYYIRKRSGSLSRKPFTFSYRMQTIWRLTSSFTRIYLSDIRHYSFLLYLTRILATMKRWIIRGANSTS